MSVCVCMLFMVSRGVFIHGITSFESETVQSVRWSSGAARVCDVVAL